MKSKNINIFFIPQIYIVCWFHIKMRKHIHAFVFIFLRLLKWSIRRRSIYLKRFLFDATFLYSTQLLFLIPISLFPIFLLQQKKIRDEFLIRDISTLSLSLSLNWNVCCYFENLNYVILYVFLQRKMDEYLKNHCYMNTKLKNTNTVLFTLTTIVGKKKEITNHLVSFFDDIIEC